MNRGADWRDLPNHLLPVITDKLIYAADYLRFGAVCASWKSVYTEKSDNIPRQPPILFVLPKHEQAHNLYNLSENRFYKDLQVSLPDSTVYHGLSHGWLVLIFENQEIRLLNPFLSVNAEIHLPFFPLLRRNNRKQFDGISKVVLSSNPSSNSNFVVMALRGDHKLYFWKKGDMAWTRIHGTPYIMDVIYYNDKFYACYCWGQVHSYEVCGSSVVGLQVGDYLGYWKEKKYLVESSGELLQIVCFYDGNKVDVIDRFEVFKLDRAGDKWDQLTCLGERTLFVGDNSSSFCLPTSELPGCEPNSIYFAFNKWDLEWDYYNPVIGVYNLKDGKIKPIEQMDSKKMVIERAPIFIRPMFQFR